MLEQDGEPQIEGRVPKIGPDPNEAAAEILTIHQIEERIIDLTAGTNKGVEWLFLVETHMENGTHLRVQRTLNSPRDNPSEFTVQRILPSSPKDKTFKEEYIWPPGSPNAETLNNLGHVAGIVDLLKQVQIKKFSDKIAKGSKYLVEQGGSGLFWASLELGRANIKLVPIESDSRTYFELNHLANLDENTNSHPAKRYIFDENGTILGVVTSEIAREGSNFAEIEEAMKFQVDNGLIAPAVRDYMELAAVIDSGLKDAPLIKTGDFGE